MQLVVLVVVAGSSAKEDIMANNPFIFANVKTNGGFDFSPWGGIEGFLEASKRGQTGDVASLKRLVPDLARAVDMTAAAVASLPFDILDESDNVVDSSENWTNELGGMDNPQRLLYLLASSLCGGDAYLIPTRTSKMIFELQYCAPASITPQIDMKGLQWFDRATDKGKAERLYPNQIIYFWLPDSDVEIGPAKNHPLGNASLDAQVIWNMKNTVRLYGERGFVPITLLGAKGMPNEGERQKAEGFFDRLLRGGFDVLAKIVNSEALSLIRVGAGMDELKQSYMELRNDAKNSIADAFGIPAAMFMADKAYASEMDVLMRQWYTDSRFVSIYQTIEETFSKQLLKPYKKKMRFNLNALDIFQEDENSRATSLGSLVSAITTDPEVAQLSMGILGYDLDTDQESTLKKLVKDKEEDREEAKRQMQEQPNSDAPQDESVEDDAPEEDPKDEQPEVKAVSLTADEIKDLALWYDRAKQWHAKGKGAAVDWECKHLREELAAPIRLKLAEAKGDADIAAAFNLGGAVVPSVVARSEPTIGASDETIKALVMTIEKAIQMEKGKE